jgi:hypothetical protein
MCEILFPEHRFTSLFILSTPDPTRVKSIDNGLFNEPRKNPASFHLGLDGNEKRPQSLDESLTFPY